MWDSSLVRLVRYTLDKYERDNCGMLSAGLAYFAIFSLFPLILVVLSLVGFFVDPNTYAVQEQLLNLIGSDDIRDLVTETLQHFNDNRVSVGLLGFVTLFFAATGIFGALSRAFRVIWEVKPAEGASIRAAVLNAVLSKVVTFGMVVGAAALNPDLRPLGRTNQHGGLLHRLAPMAQRGAPVWAACHHAGATEHRNGSALQISARSPRAAARCLAGRNRRRRAVHCAPGFCGPDLRPDQLLVFWRAGRRHGSTNLDLLLLPGDPGGRRAFLRLG